MIRQAAVDAYERNVLVPIQNNFPPEVSVSVNFRVPVIVESISPFAHVAVKVPEAEYDWTGRFLAPQFSVETREDKILVPTLAGGYVEYLVYSEFTETMVRFQFTAILDAGRESEGKKSVGTQLVLAAKNILPVILQLRGDSAPSALAALSKLAER